MAMKKKSRKFSKKKSRKLNKKKCGRGTRFKRVMRGGNNISYDITDEHRKIELKFTPFFTSCKIRFYVNDKIREEGDVTNETRLTLSSNEDNLTIRKPKLNLKAQTETTKFTLKQLYNDLIYVKLFMITNNDLNNKTSKASLQQKDILDFTQPKKKVKIKFNEHKLPEDAELLDKNNILHKVYVDYVEARGISSSEYPFMVTPNELSRMGNRIIIPYTYKNKIVGHTSRFLDNKIPKYINEQQPGYVFGYDFQQPQQMFHQQFLDLK